MKKQIKKLSLNKKTISNLQPSEMNNKVGGQYTQGYCHYTVKYCGGRTKNGNTCYGHATCYTCVTCV